MMKKTKKCVALAMASLLMLFAVSCQREGASSSPAPSATPVSSAEPASSEPASQTPEAEQTTIRIAALNGPTGIGMAKLIDDSENGKTANDYEITLAGAPDAIVSQISSGELDIAAVPTNVAATLYNKTKGNVQLLALNTLGVYLTIQSLFTTVFVKNEKHLAEKQMQVWYLISVLQSRLREQLLLL